MSMTATADSRASIGSAVNWVYSSGGSRIQKQGVRKKIIYTINI